MLLWLTHCVSPSCLGRPRRLFLRACRFFFLWFRLVENKIVLGDVSWQLGLPLFVLECFFLLGIGFRLCMKWAEVAKFFSPTVAPKNPIVRLLGRGGGFWCPRAYVTTGRVLSSMSARVSSPAQGMLLALRYTKRTIINAFMKRCGLLRYTRCAFISAFTKWRGSDGWGFPWKLGGTYFACNSFFEFRVN